MTRKFIFGLALLLALSVATPSYAQTQSTEDLLKLLQTLMKQVEELQKQLATVRGEIRELKADLREGMTDDDIKKIQEILATDPVIYPEGLVTGYFGPMTKQAIKRFQSRHKLFESGEIDEETRALLTAYYKERTTAGVPPGLLKAPGIQKKIEDRIIKGEDINLNCDRLKIPGPICQAKLGTAKKATSTKETNASSTEAARAKASAMIVDAKEAIDDLTDLIASASTTVPTDDLEDAKDELDEAKSYLSSAERAYDSRDYKRAYEQAKKAKESAEDGMEELREDDESSEANADIAETMRNIRTQAEIVYNASLDYSYITLCSDSRITTRIQKAMKYAGSSAIYQPTSHGLATWVATNSITPANRIAGCRATATNYLVATPLASPRTAFWCIDSTGNSKQVSSAPAAGVYICN